MAKITHFVRLSSDTVFALIDGIDRLCVSPDLTKEQINELDSLWDALNTGEAVTLSLESTIPED